jgi:hypothetical protein
MHFYLNANPLLAARAFSQANEYVEIQREQCDLLNEAVKEMNTSYRNVEDSISIQIKEDLVKYEEWKQASKCRRLKKE